MSSPSPSIARVRAEADEVHKSLERAIDTAIARGESLDTMNARGAALAEDAQRYRVIARNLRRRECVNRTASLCFYLILVAIVIMFAALGACVFTRGC